MKNLKAVFFIVAVLFAVGGDNNPAFAVGDKVYKAKLLVFQEPGANLGQGEKFTVLNPGQPQKIKFILTPQDALGGKIFGYLPIDPNLVVAPVGNTQIKKLAAKDVQENTMFADDGVYEFELHPVGAHSYEADLEISGNRIGFLEEMLWFVFASDKSRNYIDAYSSFGSKDVQVGTFRVLCEKPQNQEWIEKILLQAQALHGRADDSGYPKYGYKTFEDVPGHSMAMVFVDTYWNDKSSYGGYTFYLAGRDPNPSWDKFFECGECGRAYAQIVSWFNTNRKCIEVNSSIYLVENGTARPVLEIENFSSCLVPGLNCVGYGDFKAYLQNPQKVIELGKRQCELDHEDENGTVPAPHFFIKDYAWNDDKKVFEMKSEKEITEAEYGQMKKQADSYPKIEF